MAKTLYQYFSVTGSANTTTYDSGITSTKDEPKHIDSILIHVSGWVGNKIQVWVEREKVLEIPDYLVVTDESTGSTNTQKTTNRLIEFPLDIDLGIGKTLKVAIECGATAKNITGAYKYHITK